MEGRTKRLYQWLSRRASSFRSDPSARPAVRTVRTEVTVERQGIALLVGNTTADLEACPLCGSKLEGSKLDPECAEHASKRLLDGSISREPSALKRPPP